MFNSLVLAAGVGWRLRPLTEHTPKCLLPIHGRALLDYWIDQLAACGAIEVRINTHAHRNQMVERIAQYNSRGGLRVVECHEPALLGSAGSVAANCDLAQGVEQVVVIYADRFSNLHLRELLDFHKGHADPMTMVLFRPEDPRRRSIAVLDGTDPVIRFVAKPRDPSSNTANAGIYVLDAELYREVAAMNAFDLSADILPRLLGRMRGWQGAPYHGDIGTPKPYRRACAEAPAILSRLGYLPDGSRRAVFFDRDGTLLEFVHYLSAPSQVCVIPENVNGLMRLREEGWACVW